MILEDAHWADPTSLEAFGRIVDRIATLRVLLIVTFRPEFEAPERDGYQHARFASQHLVREVIVQQRARTGASSLTRSGQG